MLGDETDEMGRTKEQQIRDAEREVRGTGLQAMYVGLFSRLAFGAVFVLETPEMKTLDL